MSRRYLVKSAADYAACAKQLTSIRILYVPNVEIERRRTELDAIWGSAIAIPGTHRVHCVRTVDPGIVSLSKYSMQPSPELHVLVQQESAVTGIFEDQPASVKPGSYVAIPIPTERGRSVLYVAAVCSTTKNKMKSGTCKAREASEFTEILMKPIPAARILETGFLCVPNHKSAHWGPKGFDIRSGSVITNVR